MADDLKHTPLYEIHRALDGKMVSFAGYEMPVQYPSGIWPSTGRSGKARAYSTCRTWASSRSAGRTGTRW